MSFGGSGGSGSGSIAGSSDVSLSNPATDEYLGYDATSSKWQNTSLAGKAALANGGGAETVATNYTASGAVTLDLADGNAFRLTLQGDVTFSFVGATNLKFCAIVVILKQDATGGRTVTWPTGVLWPDGIVPTLNTNADSLSILVFESIDGGNQWFGSLAGTNFK